MASPCFPLYASDQPVSQEPESGRYGFFLVFPRSRNSRKSTLTLPGDCFIHKFPETLDPASRMSTVLDVQPRWRNAMKLRFLILLALYAQVLSCSRNHASHTALKTQVHAVNAPAESLNPDNFWTYFVGTWQDPAYRGYIKFSIELDAQGAFQSLIWHPERFKYHADHLSTLPAYAGLNASQLDAVSLYEKGRRLLLGTLLIPVPVEQYNQPEMVDIQLIGLDPIQPEAVQAVFTLISQHLPVPPQHMFYLPVAEQLNFTTQQKARFEALGIPFAARDLGHERICYNAGWGVGQVRVIQDGELDGLLAEGALGSNDILVLDAVPRELPLVAGIVVGQTSSPSSHPALLAGMLGIPFVYEKEATTQDSWLKLAASGEPVFFQAIGDNAGDCQFLLRDGHALAREEAAALSALKKPKALRIADYDRSSTQAMHLDQLGRSDANRVGAKAANVAELRRIIPDHTVMEGLALPLGLFADALQKAGTADGQNLRARLDQELAQLLAPGVSPRSTVEGLARMRALIEEARLPASLQRRILDAVAAVFPAGTRIKLRSSSNIEDHPEFNGAGLYESKGACVGDDDNQDSVGLCEKKKDPVIRNLLKVWASLYTAKAWAARRYYGVNEDFSGMGVLVQRAYKGELANGVAISSWPAYSIIDEQASIEVQSTAFPGEDLEVANPPPGKIPETTRITRDQIELLIASSELPRGRMLMTDDLYRQLHEQMNIVHQHYYNALQPADAYAFKLDMEWKLIDAGGTRKIIIKQVRPVPMPSSSTQGLDRGLMLIGEGQATLCPTPTEHRKALTRLQLGRPLQFSMALHEVPLDDQRSIPNPLRRLMVEGQALDLHPSARVDYTDWEEIWGTSHEFRSYTVSAPLTLDGQRFELQWTGRQERARSQPRLLLNQVQSIWTSDLRLRQNPDDFEAFQVVLGDHRCESDAYQGFQPGSFLASHPFAQKRQEPQAYSENYQGQNSRLGLDIEARSAFQGYDKTRFLHIDRVLIRGLLPRELTLTTPFKAVYAPAHHNFSFEYAFDVLAADRITDAERKQLLRRGIHRLILRSISPFSTIWEEPGLPESSQEVTYQLLAVNAAGEETILDTLLLTAKTDFMDNGSASGIGIFR
jgi:hypothetical protein